MAEMYRDKEMITLNLISIGMKATNAKIMGSYLFNKYINASLTENGKTVSGKIAEEECRNMLLQSQATSPDCPFIKGKSVKALA
jgi:hypothetical protein